MLACWPSSHTKAKCLAANVETGGKKWIDGACAMTDSDGDVVFSSFDTRDLDKAQPKIDCGTHLITGGTGKYKGITGMRGLAQSNLWQAIPGRAYEFTPRTANRSPTSMPTTGRSRTR